MNKKIISLLFVFLCFIVCLNVTTAADTSDNNTLTDTFTVQTADNTDNNDLLTDDTNNQKTIEKEYKTEAKTAANNVEVSSYTQLVQQVEQAKNSNATTYTINLKKGNYNATANMTWAKGQQKTKKLIINANNITLDGQNKYQFFTIKSGYTLEINNIVLKNFKGSDGGVIDNKGTLTINNSTLTNNQAYLGGTIYNRYSNCTISNSILTNNQAYDSGGAIYNTEYCKCTISNSTLTNNQASGIGAIYNYWGCNCTISNSILINNNATWSGAIYNSNSNCTIKNSKLINNTAEEYGGAIYNDYSSNCIISNSTLINNKVKEYGGAIYNYGYSNCTINNSTLTNNQATIYGEAIYNYGYSNCTINNSSITNNNATWSGAICNDYSSNCTISNSNINNLTYVVGSNIGLNDTLKLINNLNGINSVTIIIKSGFTVYNGFILGNCKSSVRELIIYGNNNVLNGNGKCQFMKVCEGYTLTLNNITLKNFIGDYGGAINNWYGTVNLINSTLINNTAKRGGAIYNYRGQVTTINSNITDNPATEVGDNIYTYSSNETIITITGIINNVYREKMNITGKITNSENIKLAHVTLYVTLNGYSQKVTADKNGVFSILIKANKTGENKITIKSKQYTKYNSSTITQTFNVAKRATTIKLDPIENTKIKETITITGRVTDKTDTKLKKFNVYITLDGKTKQVKTDDNGTFTCTFLARTLGINNITIEYKGNSNYQNSKITTTVNVA